MAAASSSVNFTFDEVKALFGENATVKGMIKMMMLVMRDRRSMVDLTKIFSSTFILDKVDTL